MDGAAEESLARMALDGRPAVRSVDVDLAERTVTVLHRDEGEAIAAVFLIVVRGAFGTLRLAR